jgi:hypothetical protein
MPAMRQNVVAPDIYQTITRSVIRKISTAVQPYLRVVVSLAS